ncbi:MAG: hypothetical protein HRJ53_22250 [Acidobacteria bacterium Pan2503]|uniref:Uncharacterized protein n=1 Tax=Candidatus Acidiferrum panamense TaxID=2741543 RepID=A0A7V8NUJ8_9BACT|nr:hypothetical protein [Candidatus Acidoferrum panamensis]
MTKETQAPWPRVRDTGTERRAPTAFFVTANAYQKSERSVAGPLRMGTAPGVGPTGALRNGSSDWSMDRISPRRFDPIGDSLNRAGEQQTSPLLSRELRGNNRRKED